MSRAVEVVVAGHLVFHSCRLAGRTLAAALWAAAEEAAASSAVVAAEVLVEAVVEPEVGVDVR